MDNLYNLLMHFVIWVIITIKLCDDTDINREIRNMYMRTNMF